MMNRKGGIWREVVLLSKQLIEVMVMDMVMDMVMVMVIQVMAMVIMIMIMIIMQQGDGGQLLESDRTTLIVCQIYHHLEVDNNNINEKAMISIIAIS